MWQAFLNSNKKGICRPFIDLDTVLDAKVLDFYTDAAKGHLLGVGGMYNKKWIFAQWEPGYIEAYNPSIEYLELFGICLAYFAWAQDLQNKRIVLFCDNQSVVTMVNSTSSKCKQCMVLIRMLTLKCLHYNTRIFCRWVPGK